MSSPAVFLAVTLVAATPSPTPPPGGYSEPWEVSPGIGGFLAFFVLGLALVVIARFMARSVRRIDHSTGNQPTAPVPEGGIARPGEPLEGSRMPDADGNVPGVSGDFRVQGPVVGGVDGVDGSPGSGRRRNRWQR